MLSRSTSPLRKQQRGNEPSISSRIAFRSGIARASSGTPLARDGSQRLCVECDGVSGLPYRDDEVRPDATDMTLLANAAHDLRQPAAAILICSELLTDDVGRTVTKEQRAWIDSIHSASQFMLRLLADTLELSHGGADPLRVEPSTVAAIVEQCIAMSRPLAARKNMRLALVEEGEPVPLLLDAIKISKVFNNLIENAVKYCQPGARIVIRISRNQDEVLVSVRDNGPGIDPSDFNTLFTPFQRTLARARSEEQGTGLGLAIARRILDLHGGQIRAESRLGKGTTFYVSLPNQTPNPKKS